MVPCILGEGVVHSYYLFFLCVFESTSDVAGRVSWAVAAELRFCLLLLASPYLSFPPCESGNGVIRD